MREGGEERRGDKKKERKKPRHSETQSVSLRAKMWPEKKRVKGKRNVAQGCV